MNKDTQPGEAVPGWQGPEWPRLQGPPLRSPSNYTFLVCLLPATGLLSTWWQNSVVEVESEDFEVHQTQVGAGV